MSQLHDKRIRLLMVKRYLNAETSIEEERELGEFYAPRPPKSSLRKMRMCGCYYRPHPPMTRTSSCRKVKW